MSRKRYGIGALSSDTGCNIETIRYYERANLLPEPPRSAGGHRSYSPEIARRLAFIVRCRQLGFSIADIRQLLGVVDSGVSCEQVRAITLGHLDSVRAKIADLQRLEHVLQGAASHCKGGEAPACPIVDVLFGSAVSN